MNNFEQAVRQQLRFELGGQISIEQLYASYNKTSAKSALKQYANQLQRKLKDFSEFDVFSDESVKSVEQEQTELKLAIVKDLYMEIVAKEKEKVQASNMKAQEQELLELLSDIEKKEKASMSKDEILAKLAELRK